MKTLTISDGNWKKLTQMKLDLSHSSLDDTIGYLLIEQHSEGDSSLEPNNQDGK